MANRQARRQIERMPQVRELSKRFAEELSTMAVNFLEPIVDAQANGQEVNIAMDDVTRKAFEAKGNEMGNAMKELIASLEKNSKKQVASHVPPKIVIRGK